MAKLDIINGKITTYSASVAHVAGNLDEAFDGLDDLLRRVIILTAPDADITADSFDPKPGTPEGHLKDAVSRHRAIVAVLNTHASFAQALASGKEGDEVERMKAAFDAAGDHLSSLDPGAREGDADATLETDTDKDTAVPELSPKAAALSALGTKVFGALHFLSNVASTSKPGVFAGIAVMVSERVGVRERMDKGQEKLATLLPQVQQDMATLVELLSASVAPLTEAAGALVERSVTWSNAHRPGVGDPARLAYDTAVASMIADGRRIGATLAGTKSAVDALPPAMSEILKLFEDEKNDDGSSHALAKAVAHAHIAKR